MSVAERVVVSVFETDFDKTKDKRSEVFYIESELEKPLPSIEPFWLVH
jgi:hypothetical protein